MADLGKFYNQWKDNLFQYCAIGPLLAFFLWLSLTTATGLKSEFSTFTGQVGYDAAKIATINATSNAGGSLENVFRFAFAIIIMVAGLKFSGQVAGAAGGQAAALGGYLEGKGRSIRERIEGVPGRAAGALATTAGAVREGMSERIRREAGTRRDLFTIPFTGGKKFGYNVPTATRLFTKKGREEFGEAALERARGIGAGTHTHKLHTLEHQADEQRKLLENAGEMGTIEDIRKKMNSSDERTQLAAFKMLAEKGQVTKDDRAKFQESKLWKSLGEEEKIELGEKLEDSYYKATGGHMPMNEYRYDKETGQNITSRDHFLKSKLKIADGSGKLSSASDAESMEAFLGGNGVSKADIDEMEKKGIIAAGENVGTFKKRLTKLQEYEEISDEISSNSKEDMVKAAKWTQNGNADTQSEESVAGFYRGMTKNKQYVGSFGKDAREMHMNRLDYMYASASERVDLIKAGKMKDIMRRDGESDADYQGRVAKFNETMDASRKNLEDAKVNVAELRRELGASFDDIGTKIAGTENSGGYADNMNLDIGGIKKDLGSKAINTHGTTIFRLNGLREVIGKSGKKGGGAKDIAGMIKKVREGMADQMAQSEARGVLVDRVKYDVDDTALKNIEERIRNLKDGERLDDLTLIQLQTLLGRPENDKTIAGKLKDGAYADGTKATAKDIEKRMDQRIQAAGARGAASVYNFMMGMNSSNQQGGGKQKNKKTP